MVIVASVMKTRSHGVVTSVESRVFKFDLVTLLPLPNLPFLRIFPVPPVPYSQKVMLPKRSASKLAILVNLIVWIKMPLKLFVLKFHTKFVQ